MELSLLFSYRLGSSVSRTMIIEFERVFLPGRYRCRARASSFRPDEKHPQGQALDNKLRCQKADLCRSAQPVLFLSRDHIEDGEGDRHVRGEPPL
jgi:hypothetical protein